MSATIHATAVILNHLITICKDGEDGFRHAEQGVRNPDFKTLFGQLSMQRREFATELQTLVERCGEPPNDSGSMAGAAHRSWLDLKAEITAGNEHAILTECERGEEAAVAAYAEALSHEELDAHTRHALHQQAMAVHAARERIRELRKKFPQ